MTLQQRRLDVDERSGVYTFNNVNAGSYTVSVSAAGFSPASSGVSITSGNTTTKDFNLTRDRYATAHGAHEPDRDRDDGQFGLALLDGWH